MKKKKSVFLSNAIIFALLGLVLSPFASVAIVNTLSHEINNIASIQGFIACYGFFLTKPYIYLYLIFLGLSALVFFRSGIKRSGTDRAGDGQFGFARYMTEKEKEKCFRLVSSSSTPITTGGVVFGQKAGSGSVEQIYIEPSEECLHSMIVGITGSGKSRRSFFPTIWALGQARESMVLNDIKGELYLGSTEYLKNLGYEVYRLNLRCPEKSTYINPIDVINDRYKQGDYDNAISLANELANTVVESIKPENPGENDYFYRGAVSVIASMILLLVERAPDDKYKTLANVRRNIAQLGPQDDEGLRKLKIIMRDLPDNNIAKHEYDVALLAPHETEGCVLSNAVSALDIFSQPAVCKITSKSDFYLREIGKKPVAFFISVPEEKPMMNQLVSVLITQIYSELVPLAIENGTVLPVRVNFLIDEFSGLPRIMDFDGKMSRGRAHGIRFVLGVQDYAQFEKHYSHAAAKTIQNQAHYIVYYNSNDTGTAKNLSERMGNYTIKNESVSNSNRSNMVATTITEGSSLTGRALMRPEEVQKLKKDETLVLVTGKDPALMYTPDLSKYQANRDFDMGDKKHNQALYMRREAAEPERTDNEYFFWIYEDEGQRATVDQDKVKPFAQLKKTRKARLLLK